MANEHFIDIQHGWPDGGPMNTVAPFSDAAKTAGMVAGMVGRINDDGQWDIGVGTRDVMPHFMMHSWNDKDVEVDGGDPTTDKFPYVAVVPSAGGGGATGLPACGAFELASTEYVDDTYTPNEWLTATDSGGDAGKLASGTISTHCLVGKVSFGEASLDDQDVLGFWAYFFPPLA